MSETLLTEREAADFMKMSKSSLIRRRNRHEISFYQNGMWIRYSLENHIKPYLKRCEKSRPGDDMGLNP